MLVTRRNVCDFIGGGMAHLRWALDTSICLAAANCQVLTEAARAKELQMLFASLSWMKMPVISATTVLEHSSASVRVMVSI